MKGQLITISSPTSDESYLLTFAFPVRIKKDPSLFSKMMLELAWRTPKWIFFGSLFFPDATASGSAAEREGQ